MSYTFFFTGSSNFITCDHTWLASSPLSFTYRNPSNSSSVYRVFERHILLAIRAVAVQLHNLSKLARRDHDVVLCHQLVFINFANDGARRHNVANTQTARVVLPLFVTGVRVCVCVTAGVLPKERGEEGARARLQ